MDALVQSILVNAAVCLYAIFGFSLVRGSILAGYLKLKCGVHQSVVASLLSLLGAKQAAPINIPQRRVAKPRLQTISPRGRPATRILRTCSDKSVLEHFPEKKAKDATLQNRKKLLASHRRSRSIPIITLDYFGSSTDNLGQRTDTGNQPPTKPARKPLTFVIPPAPNRQPSQLSIVASQSEKPVFRLASLFSKEKENRHKRRERKISSPEAVQDTAKLALPRQRRTSEGNKSPLSSTDNLEHKPRKPMRRISSAPGTTDESAYLT